MKKQIFIIIVCLMLPGRAMGVSCSDIPIWSGVGATGPGLQWRSSSSSGVYYIRESSGTYSDNNGWGFCVGFANLPVWWLSGSVLYYYAGGGQRTDCGTGSSAVQTTYATTTATCSGDPAHCSNKVKDSDETGIDCGGSCTAACTALYCPPGFEVYYPTSGPPVCQKMTVADAYGNCPKGWKKTVSESGTVTCSFDQPPEPGAEGVDNPTVASDAPPLPSGGGGGTTTEDKPVVTEGAPSGAPSGTQSYTTQITQTTYNNGGDTYTTTTTTTTYYSGPGGTGTELGKKVTEEGGNPDENPGNYDFNPGVAFDDSGAIAPSEFGTEPVWDNLKTNIDPQISEVDTILRNTIIQADSGSCTLNLGTAYGRAINVNFCQYQGFLQGMGVFLVALSYAAGLIFMVERG